MPFAQGTRLALLHIITFLIHAIAEAFASLMSAVLLHVASALLTIAAVGAAVALVCTSCGLGGAALVRRRKQR